MMEQYQFVMVMMLFGMAFGSFAGMASYRLVYNVSFMPPSHCVHCDTRLGVKDLVPIFSYLWQQGKCRYCQQPIAKKYIIIESITTISFMIIAMRFSPGMLAYIVALLAVCLVIISSTDLEDYYIPDIMQLAIFVLGLFYSWLVGFSLLNIIFMPLIGLGIGLLLYYSYYYFTKREGLGWGDIKFFAVAGLYLTPESLASFYFLSGVLGVILAMGWRITMGSKEFPFGPALALALYICVVFPEVASITNYLYPVVK